MSNLALLEFQTWAERHQQAVEVHSHFGHDLVIGLLVAFAVVVLLGLLMGASRRPLGTHSNHCVSRSYAPEGPPPTYEEMAYLTEAMYPDTQVGDHWLFHSTEASASLAPRLEQE